MLEFLTFPCFSYNFISGLLCFGATVQYPSGLIFSICKSEAFGFFAISAGLELGEACRFYIKFPGENFLNIWEWGVDILEPYKLLDGIRKP